MRPLLLLLALTSLSACASTGDGAEDLTDAQLAAVREECGRFPYSRMSTADLHIRVYMQCKRDVLEGT